MSAYCGLSFWLDSLPGPLEARPPMNGDIQADVVIVGAGYTGLWTAYYLKRHQPDLDIAILEAEIAGFGASGRNGGWCSGYLTGIDKWFDNKRFRDDALRLQRLMFDAVAEVGRVCEHENIDAHFEQAGTIEFAVNAAQKQRLAEEHRHVKALGFGDEDYRWLEGEAARRLLPAAGMQAAILMAHTAAVHPARLARGLADTVERMGVRIFERSAVSKLEGNNAVTPFGQARGDCLLLATEGYSDSIDGRQRRMIPIHSMMVVTEPLTDELIAELGLKRRYCFGSIHHLVTYGQLTADRRIAFGCRGSYRYGSGIHRFDGSEPDFHVVRETLIQFFPALRDTQFTQAWGGCMGVTRRMQPAIRFDRKSGRGWAGGYFGNGVGASQLAGRSLADLVLARETDRLRTPWIDPVEEDRRWEPEPLRWLGIKAARSLMHLADRQESRGSSLAGATRRVLGAIW